MDSARAVVWGANSHGQLCLPHLRDCHAPSHCALTGFPEDATVAMVACGGSHTVIVDSQHHVYCCGSLDDLPEDAVPPTFVCVWPLSFASPVVVSTVACGFDHSVLVLASGACFAWGFNDHGQLGANNDEILYSEQPRAIARLPAALSVSCGLHTCVAICSAISSSASDCTVWEWGAKCGYSPRQVDLPFGAVPSVVAAGARHRACACHDGRLFLWGSGIALQGLSSLPFPVEGACVSSSVHALACTWRGTAFVSSDGRVNILGPNDFLQHGSVSMSRRGVISFATGCKCIKLYAGSEHFVAVVASSDGGLRVFTWGWGEHGQLGNGSVNDSGPCGVLDLAPHQRVHVAAGAAFVVVVSEEEKFHSSCAHRPNSEVQMQH